MILILQHCDKGKVVEVIERAKNIGEEEMKIYATEELQDNETIVYDVIILDMYHYTFVKNP